MEENISDKVKPHKFKILSGVLGVLVFAGAVFGAYKFGQRQVQPGPQPTPTPEAVATPTPDETANWKTYSNERFGYEIKYPPSFTIYSFASNCSHILSGDRTSKDTTWVSIGVREVGGKGEGDHCFPTGLGVVEREEELGQFVFRADSEEYQLRDVRLVVPPDDDVWGALTLDRLVWSTIKNKSGREDFSIFYIFPYSRYASEISTVRRILSTFKFLE